MSEIVFPERGFPIHELANLGPMQEEAIIELMDDIKRYGYNPDFPIRIMNGKILDGRHRQEACLRLGVTPLIESIKPRGGAAVFVAQINSLKTYRKIQTKDRMIYAAENFTDESAGVAQKRLGFSNAQYAALLKAYKKARKSKLSPNPWTVYKDGGTMKALFASLGLEPPVGARTVTHSELQGDLNSAEADADLYKEMVATRDAEIKELEKRVKKLDPQERISRSASGDTDVEDRLRDRLEFTEDELKKSQKINGQFAAKVKDLERLGNVFDQVFSNVDWTARKVAPPVPAREGTTRPHEFLALMSDAHYGEVVEPSAALGISYNCDIAQRRIEHYRDVIVRYKDLRSPAYNIDKLTVAVLGDMLSGEIHDELRVTNEKSIVEQEAEMTNILWDIACDLAGEFPLVEFVVIPGNHPRLHKKPEFKQKWANWEWSMGKGLQKLVEVGPLENVIVTVPEAMVYTHKIFNFNIAMTHGDGIKSNSFAGIPFYGMRQRRERLQELYSSRDLGRADLFVMGHFHQHLYWGGADCGILINGAIKGGDEYSIGTFLSAPDPVQVLLEFHPEHGVAAQEHISLGQIT